MSFDTLFPQLAIFPLRPIVRSPAGVACTCAKGAACKSIGKHPACWWRKVAAGHKCNGADGCAACFDAPVDSDGLGIATGARSGVFVIDLDGIEGIRAFAAMGPIPRTFTVCRGPERGHLYFRYPGFHVRNSGNELAPKIDVRGDGGFVVAPMSPHKSGQRYEIADDVPVADAPEWLLSWSGLRQSKARVHENTSEALAELEARVESVPRAWRVERARSWLATRPAAVSGERGGAFTMRTLSVAVRENLLTDSDMVSEAIADWNARCDPPWEGSELEHKIREVLHRSRVPWNEALPLYYAVSSRLAARLRGAA